MEQKSHIIFEFEPETEDQAGSKPTIMTYNPDDTTERILKVRLDKWLWAARFFKTRALARAAIENGKVFYDGQKVIPSKEIEIGASLAINQGRGKKLIIIRGLSTRRRNADEANALFEELHSSDPCSDFGNSLEYTPIENDQLSKPKRIVRFLRRTMAIGDPSSNHVEYEQKDPIKVS